MFDALRYQVEPNRMGFALESGEAAWSAGDPAPNSGFHCGAHAGYHIDQPFDLNFDIRNQTCLQLAKYGIDVKYHHHEVGGAGQFEIEPMLGEMSKMADATMSMVTRSIDAFVRRDLEMAQGVIQADDVVDGLFSAVREELTGLIREDPANGSQALDFLMIAKYFERIGDHAVNIAEWVVYAITGVHRTAEESKEDV